MDITITLSAPNLAELTAGMRTILDQLERGATLPPDVQRVADAAEAAAPPVAAHEPVEATPAPQAEEKPASAPAAEAVTIEDVRAVLVQLRRAKGAAAASELIKKYGGSKLSDVPEENRAALRDEALALADAEVPF